MPNMKLDIRIRPFWTEIHTKGSRWIIDPILQRYYRSPLIGLVRENPDWGNAKAGYNQDFIWHDYHSIEIHTSCEFFCPVKMDFFESTIFHLHITVELDERYPEFRGEIFNSTCAPEPRLIYGGEQDPSMRSSLVNLDRQM